MIIILLNKKNEIYMPICNIVNQNHNGSLQSILAILASKSTNEINATVIIIKTEECLTFTEITRAKFQENDELSSR